MLKLAFRNLHRQSGRTLFTLAAIIFGVAGVVVSGGFVEDIFVQLREFTIHSQIGHVQVLKQGFTKYGNREPYKFLIENPDEVRAIFPRWPEILDVAERIRFVGLANNGRSDYPILGEGVEPNKEANLGNMFSIIAGRQLEDSDKAGILVGKGVASALKVKEGDFLTILTNTTGGALNSLEFQITGIFQSFSKDFDDRAIRIRLSAAQDLLATRGIHSLVFSLKKSDDTDLIAGRLREQLAAEQYEIKPWHELADFYQKTVALYRRQFGVLECIVLAMVLLGVAGNVNMAVYERTGEFGTLKALGNRPSEIFWLIMLEYSFLGLAGAALGAILGILLAWLVSTIGIPMPPLPNSDLGYTAHIRIVPGIAAAGFAIGFFGTILAAIFPARKASLLPVASGLRANV